MGVSLCESRLDPSFSPLLWGPGAPWSQVAHRLALVVLHSVAAWNPGETVVCWSHLLHYWLLEIGHSDGFDTMDIGR